MCLGVIRLQLQGPAEAGLGFRGLLQLPEGVAEIVEGHGKGRLHRQGSLPAGHGLLVAAQSRTMLPRLL